MTTPYDERQTVVPVHVVSDATKLPVKSKEIVVSCNSYPLPSVGSTVQVLAHSPKRCRAEIIVNGTGQVVFGNSQSDCQAAIANAAGEITGNIALVYGNGSAEHFPVYGNSELWAGLISVANPNVTNNVATVVSAIKEFEQ